MSDHKRLYTPVKGKTYSLFAQGDDSERYFAEIEHLVDLFLQRCPDEGKLLGLIRKAAKIPFLEGWKASRADRKTIQLVKETLRQFLSIYTQDVSHHLQSLPLAKRFDSTLSTKEKNTTST